MVSNQWSARWKTDSLALLLFFVISLAANAPLLAPYELYLDDYSQFDQGVVGWFASRGLWRIAGTVLPGWLVANGLYGLAAICLHAIGGYLFYGVVRDGLRSVPLALFSSVIMVAFPWGYQALVWASAFSYALASCVLWGIVLVLMNARCDGVSAYLLAGVLALASFLCLLFHEAAFFPLCFAGVIVWARRSHSWARWKCALVVSTAPLLGAMTWGVAYEAFKPEHPIKEVTNIHLPSVLSALFNQMKGVEVFDVWTNGSLRDHAISATGAFYVICAVVAVCAAPFLVRMLSYNEARCEVRKTSFRSSDITPGALFICLLILLVGAAGIYALAGGYSFDARKRYLIMPFLIMAAAAALFILCEPKRARAYLALAGTLVTSALCVIGCATSFLIMSVWTGEMQRLNRLADLITDHRVAGDLSVVWNPDVYRIWPSAERSWGIEAAAGLREALIARGSEAISLTAESAQRIVWDIRRQRWLLSGVNEAAWNAPAGANSSQDLIRDLE